ncbi:MAG: AsmA-like C-terminal region-containing protein [Reichenbachiella sp.]|uniref:AsmA-like C-terminal region-containing protein n=1 Tax=Reichenbachiella sp. TaxID=2184521 RepID=UPI0032672B02
MAKRIKWFLIFIIKMVLVFVLIISLTLGILLNIVFTPEKITPWAEQAVNNEIDGDFSASSIELTFYSTFPNLSVEIQDGLIVVNHLTDSISNRSALDSLVSFETCDISINPLSFLQKNKVDVNHVILEKPVINAYINAEGKPNWDFMKTTTPSDTTLSAADTDTTAINYEIGQVRILNGDVLYLDDSVSYMAKVSGLNLNLSAFIGVELAELVIESSIAKFRFEESKEILADDLSLKMNTKLEYNFLTSRLNFDTTTMSINENQLEALGYIQQDTSGIIDMDLDLNLDVPSINNVIALIPHKYIELENKFTAKGSLLLSTKLVGQYGNEVMPTMAINLKLKNGGLEYPDLPNKIDHLEVDLKSFLDPTLNRKSHININKIEVKSKGVALQLSGTAKDALGHAQLSLTAAGNIIFGEIKNTIPLENISLDGEANFDLKSEFALDDIKNNDYGKIAALGKIGLDNIHFTYKSDSLVFESKRSVLILGHEQIDTLVDNNQSREFEGNFRFSRLKFSVTNQIKAEVRKLFVTVKTNPWQDSTQIADVISSLRFRDATLNLSDTTNVSAAYASGKIALSPSKKNKSIPAIHSTFKFDSIKAISGKNTLSLKKGKYSFDMVRKRDDEWPTTGYLTFSSLFIYTPSFPKTIRFARTRFDLKPQILTLTNARVRIGKSNMTLSGRVFNLQETIFKGKALRAKLDVTSTNLDINQLIGIMNKGAINDQELAASNEQTDTLSVDDEESSELESFVIPKGIDFTLKSKFDNVKFGDLMFNDVKGTMLIKNQSIILRKINMKTKAVDILTSVKYNAKNKKLAKAEFKINLTDIDVANLVEVMPFLDTLYPMARSFEGQVNFAIQGRSRLNNRLEIIEPSLKAIARIQGQNLVLLDGETFSYISKTLMFKNKDRNLIDSASFEMMIEDGVMTLFPSIVNVDRYKIAIGGIHNLDLTYDYHISVLKSPAPFKAGIDIFGDSEDYDYKVTKAKYKYLFSDKERHQNKADTTILNKKNEIMKKLQF